MSFDFLDILIIGVLLFVIIGIMIGRGEDVIRLFTSKKDVPGAPKYDTRKEIKAILIFSLILLGNEFIMKLGQVIDKGFYILGIIIVVLDIAGILFYLSKYAKIN